MAFQPAKIDVRRQYPLYAVQEFDVNDLEVGVDVEAIRLPPNALVVGGWLDITEAFAATNTISVGETVGGTTDADKYLAATAVSSTGLTALSTPPLADGAITGPDGAITMNLAVGGGTGKGSLVVEYIEIGRHNEFYTHRG